MRWPEVKSNAKNSCKIDNCARANKNRRVKQTIRTTLVAAFLFGTFAHGANSDWAEAPQPVYPLRAALEGDAGEVKLRLFLNRDGGVRDAKIVRSTGKPVLDYAARAAVLQWRMKLGKVQQQDLSGGRIVAVSFQRNEKDKAIAAAVMRKAFEKGTAWKHGGSVPFPAQALGNNLEKTVRMRFTIGADAHPRAVEVLQSSGVAELDRAAVNDIQTWVAHRGWIGETAEAPIMFFKGIRSPKPAPAKPGTGPTVDMTAMIHTPTPDYPYEA